MKSDSGPLQLIEGFLTNQLSHRDKIGITIRVNCGFAAQLQHPQHIMPSRIILTDKEDTLKSICQIKGSKSQHLRSSRAQTRLEIGGVSCRARYALSGSYHLEARHEWSQYHRQDVNIGQLSFQSLGQFRNTE